MKRIRRFHRDHSVSEQVEPLHPCGQPIRASTKPGLGTRSVGEPLGPSGGVVTMRGPEGSRSHRTAFSRNWMVSRAGDHVGVFASDVLGDDHMRTCAGSSGSFLSEEPACRLQRKVGLAGVCQNEEPLPQVRGPDLLRSKQARRNAVTHCSKVIPDLSKSES